MVGDIDEFAKDVEGGISKAEQIAESNKEMLEQANPISADIEAGVDLTVDNEAAFAELLSSENCFTNTVPIPPLVLSFHVHPPVPSAVITG